MDLGLRRRLSPARFLRGEGPQAGPLRLLQRRVFILPTRQGVLFAVILLLMLIGSINYNASLGYALTFLLAALGVVAMLHTYRNLLGLRVDAGGAEPAFCGETLRVPVTVENPGTLARYAISLHFPGQPRVRVDLPAGVVQRLALPLSAKRRGRHALPRITLATVFPLGLFRAWSHVEFERRVLVYPRPARAAALPEQGLWDADPGGDRGRGADDFVGLRDYHPGDPPGHLCWKTLARGQGLHTKQFGGDRAEALWLDWAGLPAGAGTERRLSLLTRGVLEAEAAGRRYGLRLPDGIVRPGQGARHRDRCLEALALFGREEGR